MNASTTTILQGIKQGLNKFEGIKEAITMQSTMKHRSRANSILASLTGNARIFIVTAIAASIFLVGGSQIGTAFAQPLSDPVNVLTSSDFQSWNSVSEEAEWTLSAPKAVLATGQAYISEEADWTFSAPKVVLATGQTYISEEADWTFSAPKVVFATVQSFMSEENDSLRNSPKVALATVQSFMSEENDSLRNSPMVALTTRQAYTSEESDFGI